MTEQYRADQPEDILAYYLWKTQRNRYAFLISTKTNCYG